MNQLPLQLVYLCIICAGAEEWLQPVSVLSMVQDTSGSGLIRILID